MPGTDVRLEAETGDHLLGIHQSVEGDQDRRVDVDRTLTVVGTIEVMVAADGREVEVAAAPLVAVLILDPGAMWTWKLVASGSLADGVKIISRFCQWKVPWTAADPGRWSHREGAFGGWVPNFLAELDVDRREVRARLPAGLLTLME